MFQLTLIFKYNNRGIYEYNLAIYIVNINKRGIQVDIKAHQNTEGQRVIWDIV